VHIYILAGSGADGKQDCFQAFQRFRDRRTQSLAFGPPWLDPEQVDLGIYSSLKVLVRHIQRQRVCGQSAGTDLASLKQARLTGFPAEVGRVHNQYGVGSFLHDLFKEIFGSYPGVYACGRYMSVNPLDKCGTGAVIALIDIPDAQDENGAGESSP
jgi:hypothetical protein